MVALSKTRRERKLPVQQLTILGKSSLTQRHWSQHGRADSPPAICRFAEPIASTSLFPYLPEMVSSFGVEENRVGFWTGLISATFSLCQALFGIPWGRFSDRYGRKPAILLGLTSTMLTSLMWGFSKSLPMAITARALAGAGNGNVGIIRTTVAEMVPYKELQPRAFSLMPLVWNIGSIFGPSIGGALANPLNVKPEEHIDNPSFFQMFPYSPPNLISAIFFTVGIVTGILFLEETLETLRDQRDYGLRLGDKLKAFAKSHILHKPSHASEDDETRPLIKCEDEPTTPKPRPTPPTLREVLTRQSLLNLLVYTLLALHSMGYDALLPVYMRFPSLRTPSDYTMAPSPDHPLRFAAGFSLDHFSIGLLSTGYGVFGMLIQFFVFPYVAREFGVLYCLKWCACAFPLAYLLMPFTALLPTQEWQVGVCFAIMVLKCFCGIFAFPCSTILLTNSAPSVRELATLNGFATAFSAVGRAAGPAMGGAMFTAGVNRGYIIAPWWFLAAVAVLAALPVFWLVEGDGFGGDDGEVSDEEDEEEQAAEEILTAEGLQGEAEQAGMPGPIAVSPPRPPEEEEEADEGLGALLTRTTTASSAAVEDDSAATTPGEERRRSLVAPSLSRRNSVRVMRKSSIPFGMGSQGVSRRYSSNLGQSLGTSGSFGQ